MATYELIVLGSPTNPQRDALIARMTEVTSDFEMALPDDFAIRFAHDFAQRDPKASKRTEALRSRSVATRHMGIAGKLRSEVERIGGAFDGIGAHRAIAFSLPNGNKIQAYPVVGVPTAELLNDIHDKAVQSAHGRTPCFVYDQVGIRPAWIAHLAWLDQQINVVRALKVLDAGWELAQWDS